MKKDIFNPYRALLLCLEYICKGGWEACNIDDKINWNLFYQDELL